MYTRRTVRPDRWFFLFGPRGTGKSTWLRQALPAARWYDILHSDVYLRLLADPPEFRRELEALTPGTWVVVDEVQRVERSPCADRQSPEAVEVRALRIERTEASAD